MGHESHPGHGVKVGGQQEVRRQEATCKAGQGRSRKKTEMLLPKDLCVNLLSGQNKSMAEDWVKADGWLRQQACFSHHSGDRKSKIKASTVLVSHWVSLVGFEGPFVMGPLHVFLSECLPSQCLLLCVYHRS